MLVINEKLLKIKEEIQQINTIGDELKLQRLYYNVLNPNEKITLSNSGYGLNKNTDKSFSREIIELLRKRIPNYKSIPQSGFSFEVFNNIEKVNDINQNTNKNNKNVYSMNTYYEKMFYLFKLYGFIQEDTDIIALLDKYNIYPKNDKMKDNINNINKNWKKKCIVEKIYKNNVRTNFIEIKLCFRDLLKFFSLPNLEEGLPKSDIQHIGTSIGEQSETIYNTFSKYDNIKLLCSKNQYIEAFNMSSNDFRTKSARLIFSIPNLFNQFENMDYFEKLITSLNLGKNSLWLDDFSNCKIEYISPNTLKNILEFMNLQNSDLYYFIKQMEMNEDDGIEFNKEAGYFKKETF